MWGPETTNPELKPHTVRFRARSPNRKPGKGSLLAGMAKALVPRQDPKLDPGAAFKVYGRSLGFRVCGVCGDYMGRSCSISCWEFFSVGNYWDEPSCCLRLGQGHG